MAFPISLDNFSPVQDDVNDVMAADVNDLQTAIEALEDKVGVDNSTVETTIEYKVAAKENSSNKVTSFQVTPDDTHYPSEKLVKDSLDGKQATGSYEVTANKETSALDTSTTKYPCNNVVKSAVDRKMENPMTDAGDIIYGGEAGLPTALPKGTDGQLLTLASGLPEWVDPSGSVPEAGVAVSDGSDWDTSLQVIDPDNINPQTAGYLTGGTGHSALSVFQALASGSNDGKFKINVDGTEHDNLAVVLPYAIYTNDISQTAANNNLNHTADSTMTAQTFTVPAERKYLNKARIKLHRLGSPSGNFEVSVYATSGGTPTGPALKTATILASSVVSADVYEFDFTGLEVTPGAVYALVTHISGVDYSNYISVWYYAANLYAGGEFFVGTYPGNSWQSLAGDAYFQIDFSTNVTSLSELATALQTSIRTATGSTETVIYDTDHFKITSSVIGRSSKILKLMTPTTGTDISGAGATPYLDMADNATETQGLGEDYKLPRLTDKGLLPEAILPQWILDLKP